MVQQINLYYLLPTKVGFQLTRHVVLSTYCVLLIVLMCIYGVELRQKQYLNSSFVTLNMQAQLLQQQLLSLTEKYPVSDKVVLKNTVHELQQKLASKSKLLNLLSYKVNFSAYLLGLAAFTVQDVWLTEIAFNNPDQKISVKGFVLQSVLVEKLLAQLSKEPVFSAFKFEVQNISESTLPPSFEVVAREGTTA